MWRLVDEPDFGEGICLELSIDHGSNTVLRLLATSVQWGEIQIRGCSCDVLVLVARTEEVMDDDTGESEQETRYLRWMLLGLCRPRKKCVEEVPRVW